MVGITKLLNYLIHPDKLSLLYKFQNLELTRFYNWHIALNCDIWGPSGASPLFITSLFQHILFQRLLTQVEAIVAVIGKIAPGMSLAPQGSEKVGLL